MFVGDEPVSAGFTAIPVLCFAIELAQGSWILVDAGVDPLADGGAAGGPAPSPLLRRAAELGFFRFKPSWRHAERIREMGIERRAIRAVVLTHLDYDHTAGLRDLKDVPVRVSAEEWAYAARPGRFERWVGRQRSADLAGLERAEPLPLARDRALPRVPGAAAVPEGEGAVSLVALPGHTPGHSGVLIRLQGGARLLLCGDSVITVEQVTRGRPLGLFSRSFATDLLQAERTVEELCRWSDVEPSLRIAPSHDPALGALCAGGPARIA